MSLLVFCDAGVSVPENVTANRPPPVKTVIVEPGMHSVNDEAVVTYCGTEVLEELCIVGENEIPPSAEIRILVVCAPVEKAMSRPLDRTMKLDINVLAPEKV